MRQSSPRLHSRPRPRKANPKPGSVPPAPEPPDLIELLECAVAAMRAVVAEKLRVFGSAGAARL